MECEEAGGARTPGIRRGGTFTVTASKTVTVPVDRLFAAFADRRLRERWLLGAGLRERRAQVGRSARFDWDDGHRTRVNATLTEVGGEKSQVGEEHERLPDAHARDEARAYWRERLAALKTLPER